MQGRLEVVSVAHNSSKEAEGVIFFATSKAREFQLDHLLILLDSFEVVQAIEGKNDWILRSCVADILCSAKSFASSTFCHFSRDLNIVAHEFSKFCYASDMKSEYFNLIVS